MDDTIMQLVPQTEAEDTNDEMLTFTQLLDLPVAGLQIVQTSEQVYEPYPKRPDVAPQLARNADGLWVLTVRRQGKHGLFDLPYIESQILLADPDAGLIIVLVAYHGTDTYGKRGDKHVTKGQFYRYYQQQASGDWQQLLWRQCSDELRQFIIQTVQENAPAWARKPGKLQSERNPPAPPVAMTSYKVVRKIGERFFSLYDPTQEYIIGQRVKQAAKPGHKGGFFSYPTQEDGEQYLKGCSVSIPFHTEVETPELALLECEIGGRIINYGHKMASTYLCPLRIIETRAVEGCR